MNFTPAICNSVLQKKKEKKICYHEPGVMVGAGHLMINKIDLHH